MIVTRSPKEPPNLTPDTTPTPTATGTPTNTPTATVTPINTPTPTPVPAADAMIYKTDLAPVLDGTVDGIWGSVSPFTFNNTIRGIAVPAADLSASYRVLYDNTNLYLLVEVTDDALVNDTVETGWYQDDTIEFYLDGDHNRGGTYDDVNDFELAVRWNDGNTIIPGPNSAPAPPGAQAVLVDSANGYVVEMQIPLDDIHPGLGDGDYIGLDVHVNDDDDGGNRDSKLAWRATIDDSWKDTTLFATAILNPSIVPTPTTTPNNTPTNTPTSTPTATVSPTPALSDTVPPTGGFVLPEPARQVVPPIRLVARAEDNEGGSGLRSVRFFSATQPEGPWILIVDPEGDGREDFDPISEVKIYGCVWNMADVPEGEVFAKVEITDQNNNQLSDVRNMFKQQGSPDNVPPDGDFIFPGPDVKVEPPVTLSAWAEDEDGGSGIAYVRFSGIWENSGHRLAVDFEPPFEYLWDMESVPYGPVTIRIRAFDRAGNISPVRLRTIHKKGMNMYLPLTMN